MQIDYASLHRSITVPISGVISSTTPIYGVKMLILEKRSLMESATLKFIQEYKHLACETIHPVSVYYRLIYSNI